MVHAISRRGKATGRSKRQTIKAPNLLQLLLGAKLVGVAALLLAAVDGTDRQTGVAAAVRGIREAVIDTVHSNTELGGSIGAP